MTEYSSLLNDKILKERSRLLILSYLMASEKNSTAFMVLQKKIGLTRGNLSVQIKTLADAGYVQVKKEFINNVPQTTIAITEKGILSLKKYLSEMETIIKLAEEKEL
jgi:DNA-binding HxlR family transcriptional regulator